MTMENGLVMAGPNWINRELTYVQLSRFRNETHLFCDSAVAGIDQKDLINRMSKEQPKGTIDEAMAEQWKKYEQKQERFGAEKEEKKKHTRKQDHDNEQRRQKMKMKHTM
jgi:hypothetical protein